MKNIRKILLFFMIIFLTGCSVEYDLTINEDNSITEKVVASEKTKKMESLTRLKGDTAVSYLNNMFNKDKKGKLTSYTSEDMTYATVTRTHSNIADYSSNFSSDVFENIQIQEKNGIITFVTNQSQILGGNSNYSLIYDDITIKIKIPYVVTENNADTISNDTYIWNIKKDQPLKTIRFSYKKDSKKNSVNVKISDKTYNINYGIIAGSVIIILVLIIFILIRIKNKKNNVV